MAYTPILSYWGSCTLRRLAWFGGKPMAKTMESLLETTGRTMAEIRPGEVCAKCRDLSRCDGCAFQPSQRVTSPSKPSGYLVPGKCKIAMRY